MSKYMELCKKGENHRNQYFIYEDDCYKFAINLRSALVKYLDCPENRIVWNYFSSDFTCSDNTLSVIKFNAFNNMVLIDNAHWGFSFRILLDDPECVIYGINYLDIFFYIKKDNSKFTIKYNNEIKKVDISGLPEYVEYLVPKLESELDDDFLDFLKNEKKRDIGFKIGKTSDKDN
jgi:hypothetical protein